MKWSVISATNNETILKSCLLSSPDISRATEVILQRGFSSAAAAYNAGIEKAKTDFLVLAHQDVFFPEGWLAELEKAVEVLSKKDPKWAILGIWGVQDSGDGVGNLYCAGLMQRLGGAFEVPKEVRSLDEAVLIVRKSSGVRFDEDMPGFHMYGTDICLEANRQGMKCYAISAFCIHNTNGYKMLPWDFWKCYLIMRKKWKPELPVTTACAKITFWCWPMIKWNIKQSLNILLKRHKPGKRYRIRASFIRKNLPPVSPMAESSNKPLLTFNVGAYNQEHFIRQAVEGAFAQTYSPLQIILSDDCSKDRTFEIMEEMAAAYRGPHQVVLNRNPKNLGLVGHVNRLAQLMRGEMMVMSAGDDISLPNRTEELWKVWEAGGRKSFAVHTQVTNIDENFQPDGVLKPVPVADHAGVFQEGRAHIKSYLRSTGPVVLGCTAAYSRTLFERFGPLPEEMVFEDMALTFRALLSGGLTFIDRPLVLYRLHSSNIHHSKNEFVVTWADLRADEERKKTMLKRKLTVAKSFRSDLNKAKEMGMVTEPDYSALVGEVNAFEGANAWELDYRTGNFFKRLALFLQRSKDGRQPLPGSERLVYRLMPRWCYYSTRILKNRLLALNGRAKG